jgi:hypothetical protein
VGRNLTLLRTCLATLCAALAMVFAGSSAASVVDRFQHDAHLAHEHGLHLSFSLDDNHHDHHADHGEQKGDDASDHPPGAGHHHADAPAGALNTSLASAPAAVADIVLAAAEATRAKGIRPGGLERPPRPITPPV